MLNVRMHHERNVSCQCPETDDVMALGTEHGIFILVYALEAHQQVEQTVLAQWLLFAVLPRK